MPLVLATNAAATIALVGCTLGVAFQSDNFCPVAVPILVPVPVASMMLQNESLRY